MAMPTASGISYCHSNSEQRKTNERLDLQFGELTRRLDQALAGNIQLEKKVKEMEAKTDTTPHTASGNVPRPVPSAARTSPRPIRVRMLSQTVKSDVYRRRFSMKHGDAAVYISHDLTRSPQAQRSKAVPLYKCLRQKSVLCSLPYDTILNQEGEPITTDKITALLGD